MSFYRVEHPSTAKGPYCGDVSCASTRNRPVPFQDGIGEWWRDACDAYDADLEYVFGFESLRQLYDWFRGDLQRLQDLGYLIHKYEPTDAGGHNYRHNFKVHRGKCQVIFARQRSEFDECECVDWWEVRKLGKDVDLMDELYGKDRRGRDMAEFSYQLDLVTKQLKNAGLVVYSDFGGDQLSLDLQNNS